MNTTIQESQLKKFEVYGISYLQPKLITIKELLDNEKIQIPYYQRPYKWTIRHVNQLLDDILIFNDKSAYRLGTLVIHQESKDILQIVDGQQRCITLTLIAKAIYEIHQEFLVKNYKEKAATYDPRLKNLLIRDRISQSNIQQNYQEIKRRVQKFDGSTIQFFYERCQLVQVIIGDISEAFQFFDSQNARGKDLEPHDLLKAYHLRNMAASVSQEEKLQCVATWESLNTKSLALLFENYLFRVRSWSKGTSARYFTKNDIALFKGLSTDKKEIYPYQNLHKIAHFYTEAYNKDFHRNIDNNSLPFPFQLDGWIINGQRFFEMISYYQQKIEELKDLKSIVENESTGQKILDTLDTYPTKNRQGDMYTRNIFDCALLYYLDKFGSIELDRAIEKIFIWAYCLRIRHHAVKLASMDNYACFEIPIFKNFREAISPKEALNFPYHPPKVSQNADKILIKLFQSLGYQTA